MAPPLTISDAAFASGMRHRLGLSQMLPGAPMVACDCAERPTPHLTHSMARLISHSKVSTWRDMHEHPKKLIENSASAQKDEIPAKTTCP
jgi:hypothetical protein